MPTKSKTSSADKSEAALKAELLRLRRRSALLDAVNKVIHSALVSADENELAQVCLAQAEKIAGSDFGFVCEINADNRLDTIAISYTGWDVCRVEDGSLLLAGDLEIRGIRGLVIREGRSMIFDDPWTHPEWIDPPEGHPPIKSFLGVPLKREGRVIGEVGLARKEGRFDEGDIPDIEALATAFTEALMRMRAEATARRQAAEILEISTPVLRAAKGVLVAPLVGIIDDRRAEQLTTRLLEAIDETGATVAILDISGVPSVDTHTGNHILETTRAARLMGARVVLTGISPSIAQTLVHLGVQLGKLDTCACLADGLKLGMELATE